MNFSELAVIRILLLVSRFLAKEEWRKDIDELAQHIRLYGKEAK